MEKVMFDAVILAAGDFPTHPWVTPLLDHPHVVCCDSAAMTYLQSGRQPWCSIGDGDSLSDQVKASLQFLTIPDQETNDLTKAVLWVTKRLGAEARIAILGATGRREDHTLGNISLLAEYQNMGLDVTMLTDHGVFLTCKGDRTFSPTDFPVPLEILTGHEFSVFNLTSSKLTSQGLRYPLYAFQRHWQGTLNEVTTPTFSIQADGAYLVFLSFSKRR